jgi:L-ascorbate metabolism protein UlaG (beta-lactamase superfamily)
MNIAWYGHRCVRIETKEGSVLLDPFDPKETGLRGPNIKDTLVLISEAAPSPEVLGRINDDAFVIRGAGEYERHGIAVRGIQAAQDSQQGRELGLCTMYCVIAEEITVCHLGALGQDKLTSEQLEAIGDPDILILPVGGQSALDVKVAAEIATQIEPKIIIPVQYAVPGAKYPAGPLDRFVKEIGLTPQKNETFRVVKKLLPVDQTQLVVLSS